MMPTPEEITAAMDVLKAAGCQIDTKMDLAGGLVFVIYVELERLS